MNAPITRRLIRVDGHVEDLPEPISIDAAHDLIGAEVLTTVVMRHMGYPVHVMFVDDLGDRKSLPINEEATRLYHANCRPGTTHPIRGDVLVIPDGDLA